MRRSARSVTRNQPEETKVQLLVACAWCERVRLDSWTESEEALRKLRTYEWPEPPRFSHGVCDDCFDQLLRRRDAARREAVAA